MGKYTFLTVLMMTFGLIVYNQFLQRNLLISEEELVEQFSGGQAQTIAQSAGMVAWRKINDGEIDDLDFSGTYTAWPNIESGYYAYELIDEDSLLTLNAKGRFGDQEYTVAIEFEEGVNEDEFWSPNLPWAEFSKSDITLTGSSRVVGNTGTNATHEGAVELSWATSIDSSLQIGPGGNINDVVDQANFHSGNVGGDIVNLEREQDYELPEFIEYPPKTTQIAPINMTWENTGSTLSPADYDGKYIPSLNISGGWTLNIDTGGEDRVLHVGDLNIQQGHVNIVGDGKLTIIAENDLELNGSSTFNSDGDQNKVFTYYGGSEELNFAGATNFNGSVYARDADIRIGGSGGIQGHIITGGENVTINGAAEAISRALYAPNAHVSLTGSASVTGSIISNSFSAVGNSRVYFSSEYDESLEELELVGTGDDTPQYTIRSWY
jgi:hypothetical protein